MIVPHQKKSFGILFILLVLAVPFALAYYNSTTSQVKPYELFKERFRNQLMTTAADPEPQIQVPKEQILLVKDEKIIFKKTGLVFKGLSNGHVNIDLYLLELDPETPYSLNLTKKSVSDGIWLGDVQYRLVSVKDNILRLKIQDAYSTL